VNTLSEILDQLMVLSSILY